MKRITEKECQELIFLKKSFDDLKKMQESFYNLSLEILEIEDNDWWFEFFYNDTGDIFEALEKLQ